MVIVVHLGVPHLFLLLVSFRITTQHQERPPPLLLVLPLMLTGWLAGFPKSTLLLHDSWLIAEYKQGWVATGVRLVSGCKKVHHHRVVRGDTVVAAAIIKNDNHNARGG